MKFTGTNFLRLMLPSSALNLQSWMRRNGSSARRNLVGLSSRGGGVESWFPSSGCRCPIQRLQCECDSYRCHRHHNFEPSVGSGARKCAVDNPPSEAETQIRC